MLFNTPEFIFIFLPIVLVGYFLLNKYLSYSYVIPWLTLTSICFYAFSSTNSLFLLCVSLIINFLIGKKLQNLISDTRKKSSVEIRKFLFLIGLAGNIIFLVFYKYINFIISNINIYSIKVVA